MKKVILLFLALFCLIFVDIVSAGDVQEEDGVFILTDNNFDEFLQKHDYLMVYFTGSTW